MSKFELWYPVKKPDLIYNQRFGENVIDFYAKLGMKGHNGIDFYALDGFPIYAAHDGIVTFTGEDGSAGLGAVVRTTETFNYYNTTTGALEPAYFKSIYWHIKAGSFKVKAGDAVRAGDVLALADNTGMSTGAHLHFGIKPVQKGEADWQWFNLEQNAGYLGAIDPAPYFNNYFAEDAQKVVGILESLISLLRQLLAWKTTH